MLVHKFVLKKDTKTERCAFCGLSPFQMFTDREDIENALRCLSEQARVLDIFGAQDWEELEEGVRKGSG